MTNISIEGESLAEEGEDDSVWEKVAGQLASVYF